MERRISAVKQRVPLTEINEVIFDSVCTVLTEYFVDGSGKSFRIGIWKRLIVVEKDASVYVLVV